MSINIKMLSIKGKADRLSNAKDFATDEINTVYSCLLRNLVGYF